jgi:hypothetical protein
MVKRLQQIASERELFLRLWKGDNLRELCDNGVAREISWCIAKKSRNIEAKSLMQNKGLNKNNVRFF